MRLSHCTLRFYYIFGKCLIAVILGLGSQWIDQRRSYGSGANIYADNNVETAIIKDLIFYCSYSVNTPEFFITSGKAFFKLFREPYSNDLPWLFSWGSSVGKFLSQGVVSFAYLKIAIACSVCLMQNLDPPLGDSPTCFTPRWWRGMCVNQSRHFFP